LPPDGVHNEIGDFKRGFAVLLLDELAFYRKSFAIFLKTGAPERFFDQPVCPVR
jgi:hypothetical protein